jgi:hypothetical protein
MEGPDRIETAYDDENEIAIFHCVDATREEVMAEVAHLRAAWDDKQGWYSVYIGEGHEPHHLFDLGNVVVFRNHPNRSDHVEVRLDDVVIWVRDGYDKGQVTIRRKDDGPVLEG